MLAEKIKGFKREAMQIFLTNFLGTVVDQLCFAEDADACSKVRVEERKIPS